MFEVNMTEEGNVEVIKVIGRLDVKASKDADAAFQEAAGHGRDVILDCTDLDYIASAGLRALKRLRGNVRDNGKSLVVRGVQPDVMEVLEMTGFAAMLTFE